MQMVNSLLDLIRLVVLATFDQLVTLLGVFFVFGIILYFLARFTRTTFVRSVGYKADVVWTGWLGTPVHELGHALFCILFRHRIVDMKLYNPNPQDGSLGYVSHAYNPHSTFQKIGNFFIGVGPIILGAFVLYATMYYLIPEKNAVFSLINRTNISITSLAGIIPQFKILLDTGLDTVQVLFTQSNLKNWTFWLFLYISVCVASHMELSPPDIKGMVSGLVTLVITLLVINLIARIFGFDIAKYVQIVNKYTVLFSGLFIYAVIISAANFIGSFIILSAYSLIANRRLFNPLR